MLIIGQQFGQVDTNFIEQAKMDEPTAKKGIFAMFVAILVLEFFSDMSRAKTLAYVSYHYKSYA